MSLYRSNQQPPGIIYQMQKAPAVNRTRRKGSESACGTSQPSLVVASLDKMLHDDYLCLVESGKQQIKKVRRKFKRKTWKQRQLLSESGFVLRIAPPSLSRDRRIKMKKNQSDHVADNGCSCTKLLHVNSNELAEATSHDS